MSWRGEKADHLQKSRDFSFLHDDDRSPREVQRSRPAKASDDRVPENQEKLLRLKALEKQRADKQKKQYVESSSPDERAERRETERSAGVSGSKRGPSAGYDKFGSFFGKVEKVVAKRVVDEQRAREIAARERRLAEAEKARARAESSRNGSDAKHSTRPGSSSGSRPVAKPKPQNPVTVKAQKLKDNRDYSFLYSDEPPSKPQGAEARAQPSKASRPAAEGAAKQKAVGSQSQKPRPASNGAVRPSAGQGSSSAQGRKAGASRPVSSGARDNNARDSRAHEGERRSEKEARYASGGRAERDSRAERDGRYESERRAEAGRSAGPSRVAPAGKSAGPASKGAPAKSSMASDRDKRANQERPTSAARPKATNHDRPVARDASTMKSSSMSRVLESAGQRMSQSGNAISRERVVQKSTTTETRVSHSVQRGGQSDASALKRKMAGEPARKPVIAAKSNEGRRVDRSRYGDSDSESEMRRLVAGGPSKPQSAGARISKPIVGVGAKRRVSEEPARRKTMDAPLRRKAVEEPARRRASEEVMRSRPGVAKERKRPRHSDSELESESESDGGRPRKSGVSSIIQKLFRYNPNKYADLDDEDDKNMETSFKHIQAEERRSARLAREEDEREQELIEAEERAERERKLRRQKMMK
ncbi:hypothetical protein M758_12G190600 [Ceratodon purpureus]|nr:hypothetical protein M758_12G190300 [Ceratodon purpureus]KAG0599952.1 hypothetical protein M758_12G190600 [Ceratodon purpureus]